MLQHHYIGPFCWIQWNAKCPWSWKLHKRVHITHLYQLNWEINCYNWGILRRVFVVAWWACKCRVPMKVSRVLCLQDWGSYHWQFFNFLPQQEILSLSLYQLNQIKGVVEEWCQKRWQFMTCMDRRRTCWITKKIKIKKILLYKKLREKYIKNTCVIG